MASGAKLVCLLLEPPSPGYSSGLGIYSTLGLVLSQGLFRL